MSATSLIIGLFNIAKPYLLRIGSWLLEKIIARGAKAVERLLLRRIKAMKRRAYRMTNKMLKAKLRDDKLTRLGSDAKRVRWLHRRRDNYIQMVEFIRENAARISRNVAQRMRDFAEKAGVPRIGPDERLETFKDDKAEAE